MRIRVSTKRLPSVIAALSWVNCKIEHSDAGWRFCRRILNPTNGRIRITTSIWFKAEIVAIKAAVREFGTEIRAALSLLPRITVKESSQSYTQPGLAVELDGKQVEWFSNAVAWGQEDWSKPNPYKKYSPVQFRPIAAFYLLSQKASLLARAAA